METVTVEERVGKIRSALASGDRPTAEDQFAILLQESRASTERWLRRVIATTPAIWNASAYPVSEDLRQELALEVWKRLADPTRHEMAWESMYFQALIYAQKHVATRYMCEAGYWLDVRSLRQGRQAIASLSVQYDLVDGVEASDTFSAAELTADVNAVVRRLPPKERTAVVFRHWRGMTDRAIAKELRCTDRTVQTLLRRAEGRMRAWYEGRITTGVD